MKPAIAPEATSCPGCANAFVAFAANEIERSVINFFMELPQHALVFDKGNDLVDPFAHFEI